MDNNDRACLWFLKHRDKLAKELADLRHRVEILEADPCGGCGAKVTESCRRRCAPDDCFRAFHGGSYDPIS
jgi:hypothetical protein